MKLLPQDAALKIWNEVLENMQAELHSRYALTEARRRLIGKPDEQVLAKLLEQHAVAAFGAGQVPPEDKNNITPKASGQFPTKAGVLKQVLAAVYDGFAATTDGSAERATILRDRAIDSADRVIENHRGTLGWWSRRRLKSAARKEANLQADLITDRSK